MNTDNSVIQEHDCFNLLPCGVCRLTMMMCPKYTERRESTTWTCETYGNKEK